jgi:hypothetical protein
MVWLLVDMLGLPLFCVVLVYLVESYRWWWWWWWLWSSIRWDVIGHVVLRYWGLTKVWCGGEGWYLHDCWKVLKLAKDQFLWVDPPGQHVPPCVLYGTAYWINWCLAGGTNYRSKCGTMEIRKVQSGRVKCGTPTHCNATGMGLSLALTEP